MTSAPVFGLFVSTTSAPAARSPLASGSMDGGGVDGGGVGAAGYFGFGDFADSGEEGSSSFGSPLGIPGTGTPVIPATVASGDSKGGAIAGTAAVPATAPVIIPGIRTGGSGGGFGFTLGGVLGNVSGADEGSYSQRYGSFISAGFGSVQGTSLFGTARGNGGGTSISNVGMPDGITGSGDSKDGAIVGTAAVPATAPVVIPGIQTGDGGGGYGFTFGGVLGNVSGADEGYSQAYGSANHPGFGFLHHVDMPDVITESGDSKDGAIAGTVAVPATAPVIITGIQTGDGGGGYGFTLAGAIGNVSGACEGYSQHYGSTNSAGFGSVQGTTSFGRPSGRPSISNGGGTAGNGIVPTGFGEYLAGLNPDTDTPVMFRNFPLGP
jgi:hypothetical protein